MTDEINNTPASEEAAQEKQEKQAGTEAGAQEEGHDKPAPVEEAPKSELPPLDFTSFILSLSTSVLMHLGVVENPVTKKTEKELPVARQTIDLIELLKEKTGGNLSEDEAQLMENVLRELRMLYVKAVG